jgi:hypothetical protein
LNFYEDSLLEEEWRASLSRRRAPQKTRTSPLLLWKIYGKDETRYSSELVLPTSRFR